MHILVLRGQHLVVNEDTAAGSQPVGNGDCPSGVWTGNGLHTNLVETALVREDGDVSVVACASYMVATVVSIYVAWWAACYGPDMMKAVVGGGFGLYL
jgi:hypothetical protein